MKKTAKKTATKKTVKLIPVVVTTEHRGVFFGYMRSDALNSVKGAKVDSLKLKGAQLAVYWSADLHGFMGLASKGPSDVCRIGPPADGYVTDVTSVFLATEEAVARWKAQPWAK